MNDIFYKSAVNKYLLPFCIAIDPTYQVNWHLEVIAERLERALDDLMLHNKSTCLVLELPPRHGKSDIASQKFPAWALGKYPDLPIIVTSYASTLAEGFGQKTRDLMELEEYQAHFDTRLRPDSKAKGRWLVQKPGKPNTEGDAELENTKGGYTSTGVGGPITGRGFKIGIIDDPLKNREEADSDVIREKLWDWYKSTFRTRQEGAAIKIVIMTRWNMQDLVGMLLNKMQEDLASGEKEIDVWEEIKFPAIAEKKETHRNKGEPLWPEKFNLSQLKVTENALGPYDWEALYQQNPIPSDRQEFKSEWFSYYEPVDLKDKVLEYMTTVDLAIGEQNKDDETVVMTCGKERDKPEIYVVKVTAGHFNPGETIDHIFDHVKIFKSTVGLETVQYQKALKYFIIEEQRKKEMYFNVYELKKNQGTSKDIRIRGLIPMFVAKAIKIIKIVHQKLENQLLSFPQGKYDDWADTLASQLEMWSGTLFPQKNEVKQEQVQVSDMQGTIEPKVEGGEDMDDGVLSGQDISKM